MFNDDRKVVDFADFHIEGVANRKTAGELSIILMAYINVDEIIFPDNDLELKYPSTVGTGGSDKGWKVATIAQQRCLLASHFASFASKQYSHCYLALPEYYCLKELFAYLIDDYGLPHDVTEKQIETLQTVINEFERTYVRVDKSFLFTVLKQN